jgi:hypothetical protein
MKIILKKNPTEYKGYYNKIEGSTTTFHVNRDNRVYIKWNDNSLGYTLESDLKSKISIELGDRINSIKESMTGNPGGSFVINEFGRIISPIRNSNKRFLIGTLDGIPKFHHPYTDKLFTLENDENLKLGDEWNKPYVGVIYNLHNENGIYRAYVTQDTKKFIYLKTKYLELENNLRALRYSGPVRFIVNLHGIVLTKVNDKPVYVMKIDYIKWFEDDL